MDIVLNAVGKDCFGVIMEYAQMKDEFDMCITEINKMALTTDLYTCWFDFHYEHYFEDEGYEYYYPYINDGVPENSYVEFVYFMYEIKNYNNYDTGSYLCNKSLRSIKTIKKLNPLKIKYTKMTENGN